MKSIESAIGYETKRLVIDLSFSMKILVIEDDELIAQTLTAILTSQNYAVEVAPDGEIALDLIAIYDYDLILLDVILPKLDGINLCRKIRERGLQVPILLLTACDSSHEKAIGLDAGADDYVVKPFDEEELVARVRALLRRGGGISQPILKYGLLRLDPSSAQVIYGKEELSLTPKEYGLLELLLRNNRRVFSCSMILEHLWSYEETPGEEAVRTHVKGLRHKLKVAGAPNDTIETVYGIGYRLKPLEVPKHKGSRNKREKKKLSIAEQQTIAAIAQIWQKFKPKVTEQVRQLEEAAVALSKNLLEGEFYEKAVREAHSLAGSLGTFGFARGSQLARKIEQLLRSDRTLETEEIKHFGELVRALRQEIEGEPQTGKFYAEVTEEETYLLLVVEPDYSIAQELVRSAAKIGLRGTIATNLDAAKRSIDRQHPNVILFDLDTSPNREDNLNWLAELKVSQPSVPMLVFAEQTDFTHRLQVARTGGDIFLSKSLSTKEILAAVSQALDRSEHIEATILAVDDDPKILELLQTLLKPWGLKVETLENPQRFWETLEAIEPDLLILDVEMPYVNGIELCQVVRNDPRWGELPILFLTVHQDAEIVDRVFAVGADDFVSKPIVGAELVTRIVNRLERLKLRRRVSQVPLLKTRKEIELTIAELISIQEDLRSISSELTSLDSESAKRASEIVNDNSDRLLKLIENLKKQ